MDPDYFSLTVSNAIDMSFFFAGFEESEKSLGNLAYSFGKLCYANKTVTSSHAVKG